MNKILEQSVLQTHEILNRYVAIEDALFAIPKGIVGFIKGLFKPVDYNFYTDKLTVIKKDLDTVLSGLNNSEESSLNEQELKLQLTLIEFIEKLSIAIDALFKLTTNLAKKADGKGYSAISYQSDLKEYRSKVENYYALGGRLNELYRKLI